MEEYSIKANMGFVPIYWLHTWLKKSLDSCHI